MKRIYNWFVRLFYTKSSGSSGSKYNVYESIDDLPAARYFKISKTYDFSGLIQDGSEVPYSFLEDTWHNIQDQLHEAFGKSESYAKYIKLLKNLVIIGAKTLILEGPAKKQAEMFYQMAKIDYEAFVNQKSENKLSKTIAAVDRHMRMSIDMKTVSISTFMSYLEDTRNG